MAALDWVKGYGRIGGSAALLVLAGASAASLVSPKVLTDLETFKLAPIQLVGLMMVLVGVITFGGALSHERNTSAKAIAEAAKASAEALYRQNAYKKMMAILKQHKALELTDDNYFVYKVRNSAKKLRGEMDDIARDAQDDGERLLAQALSSEAVNFISTLEFIEKESGLRFDSEDVDSTQLNKSNYKFYNDAHSHWQQQTRAIVQGASCMAGLNYLHI